MGRIVAQGAYGDAAKALMPCAIRAISSLKGIAPMMIGADGRLVLGRVEAYAATFRPSCPTDPITMNVTDIERGVRWYSPRWRDYEPNDGYIVLGDPRWLAFMQGYYMALFLQAARRPKRCDA